MQPLPVLVFSLQPRGSCVCTSVGEIESQIQKGAEYPCIVKMNIILNEPCELYKQKLCRMKSIILQTSSPIAPSLFPFALNPPLDPLGTTGACRQ